jgi:hypothetical protein
MAWLDWAADISLIIAGVCFVIMLVDLVAGHAQKMAIMNVVWPVTATYARPQVLWAYYRIGRQQGEGGASKNLVWQMVTVTATHRGSLCAICAWTGTLGGANKGYIGSCLLAPGQVWLDGNCHLRYFPTRTSENRSGVLDHDADCHAGWFRCRVSDELLPA